MDIVRRKLILVTIGTSRVNYNAFLYSRQFNSTKASGAEQTTLAKKKNEINITGLKTPSGWANQLAVL